LILLIYFFLGRHVSTRLQEVHRGKEFQSEKPNEFNFLRHLGTPTPRVEKHFLAFGFGKDACPGHYFAANEIKTALHILLLKYNIKNVNNEIAIPKIIGPYRRPSDVGIIFEKRKDI
jgi:cytochrome P450